MARQETYGTKQVCEDYGWEPEVYKAMIREGVLTLPKRHGRLGYRITEKDLIALERGKEYAEVREQLEARTALFRAGAFVGALGDTYQAAQLEKKAAKELRKEEMLKKRADEAKKNARREELMEARAGMVALAELAEELPMSSQYLAKQAHEGNVPGARKVGHFWYVPEELADSIVQDRPFLNKPLLTMYEAAWYLGIPVGYMFVSRGRGSALPHPPKTIDEEMYEAPIVVYRRVEDLDPWWAENREEVLRRVEEVGDYATSWHDMKAISAGLRALKEILDADAFTETGRRLSGRKALIAPAVEKEEDRAAVLQAWAEDLQVRLGGGEGVVPEPAGT